MENSCFSPLTEIKMCGIIERYIVKLVILIDSNLKSFDEMVSLVEDKNPLIIDTERCDESHEYKYLLNSIREFSQSNSEIMLGKFSGRESVLRELGDERPEMILALSSNRNSQHFSERPVTMFRELLKTFEKETI
jgi:hypothetical protein